MGRRWVVLLLRIPLIGFLIALVLGTAPGRDLDGRYTNSPLKSWFDQLKSAKGLCCSNADGYVVEDVDWESKDGHFRVRVPEALHSKKMVWIDVPDDAVVTEPNRAGRTMVWPIYTWLRYPDVYIYIRCFMPGSMT
jgi:hypothetical protein